MELHAIWIRIWFAHTPPLSDATKSTARENAETRYLNLAAHVAEQFGKGARFIDDLPQELLAIEDELSNALQDESKRDKAK